jgi:hemoglobin
MGNVSGKIAGILVAIAALAGCQSNAPEPLYQRVGGDVMISAIVEDFVQQAVSDPRVNFTRAGTAAEWKPNPENVALLKLHLVQFLEAGSGGPKNYEGRDMRSVHANMHITKAQFDALEADFTRSLQKYDVPAKETGEMLALVESTRKDIGEAK